MAGFLFVFCVFGCTCIHCFIFWFAVVISAIDWLERLVSEMTCYVTGMLNPVHSLTPLTPSESDIKDWDSEDRRHPMLDRSLAN